VRYEEREALLSNLIALDVYVSPFIEGPIGHKFLSSFWTPPLGMSIETRPEVARFYRLSSLYRPGFHRGQIPQNNRQFIVASAGPPPAPN